MRFEDLLYSYNKFFIFKYIYISVFFNNNFSTDWYKNQIYQNCKYLKPSLTKN